MTGTIKLIKETYGYIKDNNLGAIHYYDSSQLMYGNPQIGDTVEFRLKNKNVYDITKVDDNSNSASFLCSVTQKPAKNAVLK